MLNCCEIPVCQEDDSILMWYRRLAELLQIICCAKHVRESECFFIVKSLKDLQKTFCDHNFLPTSVR